LLEHQKPSRTKDHTPLWRLRQLSSQADLNSSNARFSENLGQWPSELCFAAQTDLGEVWFTEQGPIYMVDSGDGASHEARVDFQNGRSVPIGLDKIPVHTSYFIGQDDPVIIQPELG
jgi:hypothetical protein